MQNKTWLHCFLQRKGWKAQENIPVFFFILLLFKYSCPHFPPPLPLPPTLPSLSLSIGPLYMFFDDPPFFPPLPSSPCPSGYCQFVLYVNILKTRGKHRIDFLESQNKKEWGSLAENAVLLANACAVLLKWQNWWFPILLGRTYVPVCLGLPICMPAFLTLLKFLSSGKELRIAKTTL